MGAAGIAGSTCLACKAASTSNVMPFSPRFSAAVTIGSQYLDGIRFRCAHLRTRGTVVPISTAKSVSDDQRERRDLGEPLIPDKLGHIVLTRKAKVSRDPIKGLVQTVPMARDEPISKAKQDFIARVREARNGTPHSQEAMGELLGIGQGTYKQYESRSWLPHHLIPLFCALTLRSIEWLYTGRERAVTQATHSEKISPVVKAPRRRKPKKVA
jgi:DNA-binding XRE family transcriptional regulator